jgi:hypothetical protein
MVASMRDNGKKITDMGMECTDGKTDEYLKASSHKTDFSARLK